MEKANGTEKVMIFGRNINALGALAIAGVAAFIPGPNAVLGAWAGLNAAQAAGFEGGRRWAKKRKKKKQKQ